MKLILAFLIFGGVIAAGIATMCVICKEIGEGKDNCVGEQKKCAIDETCAIQIEYSILNDTITTVNKRCLPNAQTPSCKQLITLNTTGEFQLLVYTECCYTDGCNSGPIQMPPVDQNKNGRVCPICFIQGKDKCTEFGTRCCLGNQLQCLNFSGYAARSGQSFDLYAFQGCITTGSCLFNFTTLPGSQVAETSTFTCTDAKPLD